MSIISTGSHFRHAEWKTQHEGSWKLSIIKIENLIYASTQVMQILFYVSLFDMLSHMKAKRFRTTLRSSFRASNLIWSTISIEEDSICVPATTILHEIAKKIIQFQISTNHWFNVRYDEISWCFDSCHIKLQYEICYVRSWEHRLKFVRNIFKAQSNTEDVFMKLTSVRTVWCVCLKSIRPQQKFKRVIGFTDKVQTPTLQL